MTSVFDALDALASDAAIEGFGEEAVLTPRRGNQYVEAAADDFAKLAKQTVDTKVLLNMVTK